jgi:ribonuclease HII
MNPHTIPQWVVGVDEVGRGPLAGPVGIGVVATPAAFSWSDVPLLRDSKKLSAKQRGRVNQSLEELEAKQLLYSTVVLVGVKCINSYGIAYAIQRGLNRGLRRVRNRLPHGVPRENCHLYLDGGLHAPRTYEAQYTVVGGDSRVAHISAAAVLAKVRRDAYMVKKSTRPAYAMYGFENHKGYGTREHRAAIQTNGLSDEHRTQFCRGTLYRGLNQNL